MNRSHDVGRLLIASLHQSITDRLPMRLSFYESWLSVHGMREGTIGRAPLLAVLSFLRQEGAAYGEIVELAGTYAGTWMVQEMASTRKSLLLKAPLWLRARLVMRQARRLVQATQPDARMSSRVSGMTARITVHGSVFCGVREPVASPLCGFYVAAFTALMTSFQLPVEVRVAACRGTGEAACLFEVVQIPDQSWQSTGEAA
jgi:hypothetical protein